MKKLALAAAAAFVLALSIHAASAYTSCTTNCYGYGNSRTCTTNCY